MDLVVPPGPGLPEGLTVPGGDLTERFSRSSGPGGQGVNTSDSRVELELDVAALPLSSAQHRRLRAALRDRLTDGRLVVVASEHRRQRRNRVTARDRMAALLREALAPPPPARRPTRPTRGSKERRLSDKRRRADTKAMRARPPESG
jgi:ribosome-associated protein